MLTSAVIIFVGTNPFKEVPQYARHIVVRLPHPTDDALLIGSAATAGLKALYHDSYRYKKSGVVLMELMHQSEGKQRCSKMSTPLPGAPD